MLCSHQDVGTTRCLFSTFQADTAVFIHTFPFSFWHAGVTHWTDANSLSWLHLCHPLVNVIGPYSVRCSMLFHNFLHNSCSIKNKRKCMIVHTCDIILFYQNSLQKRAHSKTSIVNINRTESVHICNSVQRAIYMHTSVSWFHKVLKSNDRNSTEGDTCT